MDQSDVRCSTDGEELRTVVGSNSEPEPEANNMEVQVEVDVDVKSADESIPDDGEELKTVVGSNSEPETTDNIKDDVKSAGSVPDHGDSADPEKLMKLIEDDLMATHILHTQPQPLTWWDEFSRRLPAGTYLHQLIQFRTFLDFR